MKLWLAPLFLILASLIAIPALAAEDRVPLASKISKGDCSFGGKKMFGKVKIVESFPDFKVKTAESFADLHVKTVSSFPDSCGKWRYVDSFPNFTIKFVDSFPDFTIKFVDSFPGVP